MFHQSTRQALFPLPLPKPAGFKVQTGTPVRIPSQKVEITPEKIIKPPRVAGEIKDLLIEFTALKIAKTLAALLNFNLHIPNVEIQHKENGEFVLAIEKLSFDQTLTADEVSFGLNETEQNLLVNALLIDLILMDIDGHIENMAWKIGADDTLELYRYDFDLANSATLRNASVRNAVQHIRKSQGDGFALQELNKEIIYKEINRNTARFPERLEEFVIQSFNSAVTEIVEAGIELSAASSEMLENFKNDIVRQIGKLRTFDCTSRDENDLFVPPPAPKRKSFSQRFFESPPKKTKLLDSTAMPFCLSSNTDSDSFEGHRAFPKLGSSSSDGADSGLRTFRGPLFR